MLNFNLNLTESQFMEFITKDEKETQTLGQQFAAKSKERIILLEGELGSGKTTFVRGFCDYFGIKRITSPTFVIMKKYELKNKNFDYLYHIDCYRVETDLEEIRLSEILEEEKALVLIEWPEKLKKDLQGQKVKFEVVPNGRKIIIS